MWRVCGAKSLYLEEVNATCGTRYECSLCHLDSMGGGKLNASGQGYMNSGKDSCYICPDVCSPCCEFLLRQSEYIFHLTGEYAILFPFSA
jgi:hypothetical protein